jgi:hypothetical protein
MVFTKSPAHLLAFKAHLFLGSADVHSVLRKVGIQLAETPLIFADLFLASPHLHFYAIVSDF